MSTLDFTSISSVLSHVIASRFPIVVTADNALNELMFESSAIARWEENDQGVVELACFTREVIPGEVGARLSRIEPTSYKNEVGFNESYVNQEVLRSIYSGLKNQVLKLSDVTSPSTGKLFEIKPFGPVYNKLDCPLVSLSNIDVNKLAPEWAMAVYLFTKKYQLVVREYFGQPASASAEEIIKTLVQVESLCPNLRGAADRYKIVITANKLLAESEYISNARKVAQDKMTEGLASIMAAIED